MLSHCICPLPLLLLIHIPLRTAQTHHRCTCTSAHGINRAKFLSLAHLLFLQELLTSALNDNPGRQGYFKKRCYHSDPTEELINHDCASLLLSFPEDCPCVRLSPAGILGLHPPVYVPYNKESVHPKWKFILCIPGIMSWKLEWGSLLDLKALCLPWSWNSSHLC